MDILLTDDEVRVLGCLMEKEMATPDYYPLTLNALINACNQKSNRNPVVSFSEDTVIYALNGLRERKLIRQSNLSRVTKYEQIFSQELNLVSREQAIVCILLLRGPQTGGEIRSRTERLYPFPSISEVQETLANLEDMELVKKMERQPGRKESRFTHLLSGIPVEKKPVETIIRTRSSERTGQGSENLSVPDDDLSNDTADTKETLQQQIDELRQELEALRAELTTFKSQFD